MRRIRYLVIALLFVSGFLFNGELFALYFDNFQESFYKSTFSFDNLSYEISNTEITEDFIHAAENSNIDFFMIDSRIESAYMKTVTIYGTDDAIEHIENKGIHNKEYLSMFLGTIKVQLLPFNEIEDIKSIEYCYYIGDIDSLEDMRLFKARLIDKYGGGFPKIYSSDKETRLNIITVWSIIIFLMSLLHLYEILMQKKEVALRVVLGENIKRIFIRNIISDYMYISFLSFILPLLLTKFTNVVFMNALVMKLIGVSLLFSIIINLNILSINFKKHLVRNNSINKFSIVNYAVKSVITVLVILIISSNIILILNGINYYKQQSYYSDLDQYSYYRLNYKASNDKKTIEDEVLMNQIFYNRFIDHSIMSINVTRNFNATYPIVLLNKNAMEKLEKRYPELSRYIDKIKGEGQYLLIPKNVEDSPEKVLNAKLNLESIYDLDKENLNEVVSYDSQIEVVGIMNQAQFQSKNLRNPIIIYDNEVPKNDLELADRMSSYAASVMYDIENKEFISFINEFDLEDQIVSVSNVKNVYEYNKAIALRSMKFNIVIAVFLSILEISMISIIIRMEFRSNAIEIALKKIYGYTLFDRHNKLFIVTIVSIVLSYIFILIFLKFVSENSLKYILFELPVLLMIELSFIYFKARSLENKNISTILKGERI